jgi:hypothetical protein
LEGDSGGGVIGWWVGKVSKAKRKKLGGGGEKINFEFF